MKFRGRVENISDVQTGTSKAGKDWKKQEVVIEEEATEYPNSLSLTFFNKEIDFKVGDLIEVDFNIKANEFKGRWFNNLTVFKWEVHDFSKDNSTNNDNDMPSAPIAGQSGNSEQQVTSGSDDGDDLPF